MARVSGGLALLLATGGVLVWGLLLAAYALRWGDMDNLLGEWWALVPIGGSFLAVASLSFVLGALVAVARAAQGVEPLSEPLRRTLRAVVLGGFALWVVSHLVGVVDYWRFYGELQLLPKAEEMAWVLVFSIPVVLLFVLAAGAAAGARVLANRSRVPQDAWVGVRRAGAAWVAASTAVGLFVLRLVLIG